MERGEEGKDMRREWRVMGTGWVKWRGRGGSSEKDRATGVEHGKGGPQSYEALTRLALYTYFNSLRLVTITVYALNGHTDNFMPPPAVVHGAHYVPMSRANVGIVVASHEY